jgi:plasmid stabilization system protein ParE
MSGKFVEFQSGATEDVETAVAWYRERSPKAALDFIEELTRATAAIQRAPTRWSLRKRNTRRFPLWRFPFAVIYEEQESKIVILAVAHGSRRPEYWVKHD